MKCIICGINEATVPDRYTGGRLINRICSECHAKRLQKDMQHIVDLHTKRQIEEANDG